MEVLIVCDHYPISPRINKIRNSILNINSKYKVKVLVWNRALKSVKEDFVISSIMNLGMDLFHLTY